MRFTTQRDGRPNHLDQLEADRRTQGQSRRAVVRSAAALFAGLAVARSSNTVIAQEPPITIDRTIGDLVVLPAEPNAVATGSSTLQTNTDFVVRVTGDEPQLDVRAATVVGEDGRWSASLDLSGAVDDQRVIVAAIFNSDRVTAASGVIGTISASVRFDDQTLTADGQVVMVRGVSLELDGFVVVTAGDDGPILGVSEILDGRTVHSDVRIRLDSPITGTERLVATAWLDVDRDRRFDPSIDRPYPAGNPVSDSAIVQATPAQPVTPVPPPPPGSGLDLIVAVIGGSVGGVTLRRIERAIRDRRENNRPPLAQFVYLPDDPQPGVPVLFDGSHSFDPDPGDCIRQYEWSIGEARACGPRHVHVFGAAGEYDIELRVTDENDGEGLATEIVTVEQAAGRLAVAAVEPDPPDDNRDRLRRESIVLHNPGDDANDLSDLTLHAMSRTTGRVDAPSHSLSFPAGFELEPGETVAVHTGSAPENEHEVEPPADWHLYWNSLVPIWDVDAGRIVVANEEDSPVLAARYERTDGGEYDVENIDPTSLDEWYEPVDVGEPVRLPVVDVTFASRIGLAAVKNGIGLVASALFLRGSAAFVRAWTYVATFLGMALFTWLLSTGSGILRPSIGLSGPVLAFLAAMGLAGVGGVAWTAGAARAWLANRLS